MGAGIADQLAPIPMSSTLGQTLARAAQYAQEQSHKEVALDHLLLSLTEDEDARQVMLTSGVSISDLQTDVSQQIGRMEPRLPSGEGGTAAISEELRRILNAASVAARAGRRTLIDGAIVLAAIIGDGRTNAAGLLRAHGLTFEAAIEAIRQTSNPPPEQPASPAVETSPPAPIEETTAKPPFPAPEPHLSPPADTAGPQATDASEILAKARARVAADRRITGHGEKGMVAADDEPPAASDDNAGPQAGPHGDLAGAAAKAEPTPVPPGPADLPAFGGAASAPTGPVPEPTFESLEPAPQRSPEPQPPVQRSAPPQPTPFQQPPVPHPGTGWAPPPAELAPSTAAPKPRGAPPPIPPGAPSRPPAPVPAGPATIDPNRREPPWTGPAAASQGVPDSGMGIPPAVPLPSPEEVFSHFERVTVPQPSALPPPAETPAVMPGQLVETIPRRMRVGIAVPVEVRIAKAEVKAISEGLDIGNTAFRHDVQVTKAMSVRLRAPEGGFYIETASPETQWIESALGLMADDFARWRWSVTPKLRGRRRLQLIVSARTVGPDGLAAETALPDQIIEVRVSANYGVLFRRVMGWAIAAVLGGLLARFGAEAWTKVAPFIEPLMRQ
jgi:neural Wiskott-Aldrich syndrome protein